MPDLTDLFARKWKLILGLPLLAAIIALVVALLAPKEYLSTATALPANSLTADKARVFNPNIEALYSDIGTPDELDRLEGTGALDTIYIAAARELDLPGHYGEGNDEAGLMRTCWRLKKNSRINRSGYGELKVKVWDREPGVAAALANSLLNKIGALHQHLQNENNIAILDQVKKDYAEKMRQYASADSLSAQPGTEELRAARRAARVQELVEEEKLIDQYSFAVNSNPPVLLTVERARPAVYPDKPKLVPTVLFTFFAALVFALLLALFLQTRTAGREHRRS